MPTPFGIAVTVWTARLAVACYVARLLIDVRAPRFERWQRTGRWIWTVGLTIFALHVAAAFHFFHDWSHGAAWEHTRQQTLAQTGWDSGVGLWINYGFLLAWAGDVLGWWMDPRWLQRRWIYSFVQGGFAFLMLNATVVFGSRGWIPVVAAVVVALAGLGWRRTRRPRHSPPHRRSNGGF